MRKYSILILFFFTILSSGVYSQSNSKNKKDVKNRNNVMDKGATYDEYNRSGKSQTRHKGKYNNLDFEQKIEEYEKLMEANVKKYKRIEREMEKPQYSDPSYFGHKRPPKKRKPGKRKLCRECNIVH